VFTFRDSVAWSFEREQADERSAPAMKKYVKRARELCNMVARKGVTLLSES
jgi:hypothetical protein